MSESELEVKVFTRKEVEEYKSIEKGIYLIIHNQVYDVTKFLEEHPGGVDVLIENAGKEATKEFENVDHSQDAIKKMTKYYVGSIVDFEQKEIGKGKSSKNCLTSPAWINSLKTRFF